MARKRALGSNSTQINHFTLAILVKAVAKAGESSSGTTARFMMESGRTIGKLVAVFGKV